MRVGGRAAAAWWGLCWLVRARLIAMLSFTFENVRSESTLQCRTCFAQCLMRLELQAVSIRMSVNVGEHKGGRPQRSNSSGSFQGRPLIQDGRRALNALFTLNALFAGGRTGDGKYTYDFRSVVSISADADTSEAEGANDPFAVPDGGPLARIEAKLEALETRLDKMAIASSDGVTTLQAE